MCFSREQWLALGRPGEGGFDAEEHEYSREEWASTQHLLMDLLGLQQQSLRWEVVGIPGGAGARYKVRVDGEPILATGAPFPWTVSSPEGATFPLTPTAAWACAEAHRATHASTQEQLAVVVRLRGVLEDVSGLLGDRIPFAPTGFLKTFEPRAVSRLGLRWEHDADLTEVVSLRPYAVFADGTRADFSLSSVRPGGIAGEDARRPLLLPEHTDEVLARTRPLQRRLVADVTREMADPSHLIPEGRDLDASLELSQYSPRVAGFELLRGRQPGEGREATGLEWVEPSSPSESFALTLHVNETGMRLQLKSREEALEVLNRNDAALASATPMPLNVGGQQVFPSEALGRQLRIALGLSAPAGEVEVVPDDAPRAGGRLGAIVREAEAPSSAEPRVDDASPVPWEKLEQAFRPGVSLKPHQKEGLAWLWRHAVSGSPGVLLADDMGLGKTLQVACFLTLRLLMAERDARPHLVVCPTILLDNWKQELNRFFREELWQAAFILHGQDLRAVNRGDGLDTDLLAQRTLIITNYETLGAYQRSLLKVDFGVVVFDEAHLLKNPDTLRSRAARALKRSFAVALTGTPVENELFDVWAVYDAIQSRAPRVFGPRASFREEHGGAQGASTLRTRLKYPSRDSTLMRREKAEALKDLPEKRYHSHPVEMTALQEEQERLIARQAPKRGALWALSALQKLYQHPALLADSRGLSAATALQESPKTRLCLELLARVESTASGADAQKALVFVLSRAMQELLSGLIQERFRLPEVRIINGEPESRRVALDAIDEFSKARGFQVLLLSPLAAGAGLNIVAANHVIHYGRWWNPAKEDQATDRAHRIGQVRPVHVHYPLLHRQGRPDSGFDMRLHELVERKRSLARDFLAPVPDEARQYSGVFQEGDG
ncbi:DEAD/DEAH box helicase [Corallococcus carmarthensis]|uniref:DEAD/DEAH box helicase n=1 Tax=Corallococcus carmarthensis TaxID=2316728 RepID=UPI001FCA49DD|nr:DEAD/DEAH box helicase [Corallococcus carmarthensis]